MNKNIFIYAGYSPAAYNGDNYQSCDGCRGSEIALVNLAEQLAKRNNVVVSYTPIAPGIVNGVRYLPFEEIQSFLNKQEIDVLIVSRYIHFFAKFNSRAKKTFFMLHDHEVIPWMWGKELPKRGAELLKEIWHELDVVFFLSRWHRDNFRGIYGISSNEKLEIIPNGITPAKFESFSTEMKQKNRFCYNSANGGLESALKFFGRFRENHPDAELHVFTKREDFGGDGVVNRGIVGNDVMIEELIRSSFWLYPATIPETYCISALEARCAGCVPVVNCMGGMRDSLDWYYLNINDHDIMEKIDNVDFEIFWGESREKALNNSWERVSRKWESYF